MKKNLFLIFSFFCIFSLSGKEEFIQYSSIPANGHIQGLAGDGKFLYRVFNYHAVKSDLKGKTVKTVLLKRDWKKPFHAGDPCILGDKIYVPVSVSGFNRHLNGKTSLNYIQVYDLELNYIRTYSVPELEHGAGCITSDGKNFFVSGGRPYDTACNVIYEYDKEFKFRKAHKLNFTTYVGVQTLAFDGKDFWVGCFRAIPRTFRVSRDFRKIWYYNFNTSVGMIPLKDGRMIINMPMGDNRAKYVDPEKFRLQCKYIEYDMNCHAKLDGKVYTDLSVLYSRTRKFPGYLFILRFPEKFPFSKWVAVKQYIPNPHLIEIVE